MSHRGKLAWEGRVEELCGPILCCLQPLLLVVVVVILLLLLLLYLLLFILYFAEFGDEHRKMEEQHFLEIVFC